VQRHKILHLVKGGPLIGEIKKVLCGAMARELPLEVEQPIDEALKAYNSRRETAAIKGFELLAALETKLPFEGETCLTAQQVDEAWFHYK
jgi:hypothetical protein